jgi:hypothetical protein
MLDSPVPAPAERSVSQAPSAAHRSRAQSLERAASSLPPLPYNPAVPSAGVDRPIEELMRIADAAKRRAGAVREGVARVATQAAASFDPLTRVARQGLSPIKHLTET